MNFILNKKEFRESIKLRYGWEFNDMPMVCVCGDLFDADHDMICMPGGFIIQRQNEIRDLEAEILQVVCSDVEMETVFQEVTWEVLPRCTNKASERENSLRSLMLGYAILTQTHTRISPRSRYTSYTRMIKSVFTRLEFLI